jgi:hypothetical protein
MAAPSAAVRDADVAATAMVATTAMVLRESRARSQHQ